MKLPIKDTKFKLLIFSVAIVGVLEVLSILKIYIPLPYAPFVYLTFIIGIGYKVIWNGLKALSRLNFSSINLLMTIAVIGAFYLGEYPEAAVVIVLYVLGERLEDLGIQSSKTALEQLVSNSPKMAILKSDLSEVPIDKIQIGTTILIKPGAMIPLDGIITYGFTAIDESTITGEPIPKDKTIGDVVYSGTLNRNGIIEVQTTKLSKDTTFSKIIQLTFEANLNKSATQQFIQRFSSYYTPIVIFIASLIYLIPVLILHLPVSVWLNQAITLLVIACPCALVISTPVAIYAAIGNASSKGAIIKGGKYLEQLASLRALALDKTRTITFGTPVVSDVIPLNGNTKEELLACASGAEVFSEHPLAEAILAECKKLGLVPHNVENFESVLGKGATAKCMVCEDKTICIGKLSFIKEFESVSPEVEKIVEQLSEQGKTSVVVSFGKGVVGIIALMDEIKPDSPKALQQLKELGVELVMLTGDHINVAKFTAEKVHIEKIYGGLLPEDKVSKIKELLQQYQTVAMVGDGVNDAPALAQSSVGIAMGAVGNDTAIETANIALMNDRLTLIPFLIRLSRATTRRIRINTIGAIAIKFIFIGLAVMGYSNLVLAIAADVGLTLLVILFSLNLLKFNKQL
jgi:Cd2+/Zn2+-exporting ATPase